MHAKLTYIILIFGVRPVHHFEQLDLYLGLVEEGLLVFNYLYGDMALLFVVERLHHLSERSLADQGIDLVPVEELLTILNYVVVVVVVEAVVVQLALLLVGAVLPLCLGRPPLLLRVVHLER